jgi:hypothetical protein
MTTTNETKNMVYLVGDLEGEFIYHHTINNIKIFSNYISVKRDSGVKDIIPFLISETEIKKLTNFPVGITFSIEGTMVTYKHISKATGRIHTCIYIKAKKINLMPKNTKHVNEVKLSGIVANEVNYRKTPGIKNEDGTTVKPSSRITDVILKVMHPFKENTVYYIPLIMWNKMATQASYFNVNDKIYVKGRIQSRPYIKEIFTEENGAEDRKIIKKVAYEISVNYLNKIDN